MGPVTIIGLVGDAIGFADIVYGLVKDGIDSDGFENFLDPDAEMNAHFDAVNDRLDDLQSDIGDVMDSLSSLHGVVGAEFTQAAVARLTDPLSGVLAAMTSSRVEQAMTC